VPYWHIASTTFRCVIIDTNSLGSYPNLYLRNSIDLPCPKMKLRIAQNHDFNVVAGYVFDPSGRELAFCENLPEEERDDFLLFIIGYKMSRNQKDPDTCTIIRYDIHVENLLTFTRETNSR